MQRIFTYWRIYTIVRRIFAWIFFTFFGLFLITLLVLRIPSVQTWAAHKTTSWLSEKLSTKVELKRVNIDIFDHLILEGLYIEDHNRDTLLYAGKLEVNIGTINPFTPYVKVKNITLEDTYIHIYRNDTDSLYNFAFIQESFGAGDTASVKPSSSAHKRSLQLQLNRISLENTQFWMEDAVSTNAMQFSIDRSEILINTIDLEENLLALEKIEFDETVITMRALYDTIPSNKPDSYDTVHIALGGWTIETTQLLLHDCAFNYFNENSDAKTTGINFNDLAVQDLNLDMSDIIYQGDTILSVINRISLQEKSGFRVDTLSASVLFSPYEITLSNLLIATPNSSIKDQFGFIFTTLNDFDRFNSDVRMQANFKNAKVSNKDIAFFSPSLQKYDLTVLLSSSIYGSLDNLKARDFDLKMADAGGIKGTFNIKGLPAIDETFVDCELDPLSVNTQALEKITGSNLPDNILSLGTVHYKGRVTGFVYDLVSFGDLQTDIGGTYTDLNFKYDPESRSSTFRGIINTSALNIGILAGDPALLGKVSMDAAIDGKVNGDKTSEFALTANVNAIEFNQYNYANIKVDGELKNKFFEGNFSIDDPNIQMAFNGIIDYADTIPVYNFKTNIKRANLQQLHFYDEPLVCSANAAFDAQGKNVDEMTGTARFGDLYLIRDRNIYRLDTLVLSSSYSDNKKHITANSNLIDFDITGNYAVTQLPAAFKNLVNFYTNGRTDTTLAAQSADYTIKIKNADQLMAIFYPEIQILRNFTVTGNFNTADNVFNSRLRIDQFNYKTITADTLAFEARTSANKLEFFTKINAVYINKTNRIPVIVAEGNFAQNQLHYNLKVGRDVAPDRINLNGDIAFIDSVMQLNMLPSEIYFRGEKWDILANNSLQISNKNLIAENFTFSSGEKLISLTSAPDPTYTTVLKLNVKNIPIGELAEKYVLPGESVSGKLDATYSIGNVIKDPSFIGGAEIKQLTLNEKLLGNLKVNTSMIKPSNRIKFNAYLTGENGFNADGYYILGKEDSLTLTTVFNRTKLYVAEPFLRGILSDMQGDVSGKIEFNGPVNRLAMKGNLTVKKGGCRIDYMGVHYYFDELGVDIYKNRIVIPAITIKDKLNNTGTLSGEVTYSNFDNWNFKSLRLKTDHLLLMETRKEDNSDFYGYVIGEADADITGKLDELLITVTTTPHANSVVNLPTYGSGNVKKHDFIKFVNKSDTSNLKKKDELNLSIVNVDLLLNATPDAEIKLLINSEETEYLTGKGFGTLNIKANSLGKVDMLGDYEITEGLYDFSFQGLFQRPFVVVPGGTISFDGDPFKATLDLTAEYTAKDVLTSTLIETGANDKTNVNVLIDITGVLESPQIDFDIEVPKSTAGNNAEFQRRIQQIKGDKNELNKQVFGLLITNSFLPQDLTTFNAVGTTANSTLNDFVSGQLTTYFQNVLNEFLKDTEIDIGYDNIKSGTYNYTNDQGKQFDVAVKRSINENLIIKVGTTYYDFATTGTSGAASNLAGDFEVEYLITPDGRIRVKAFRVSEYDAIIAKNDVKTGVGLYYTKDFDKVKELFQKKK